MIIEGFTFTTKGNAAVIIANDFQTERATIITHKNLPYTHGFKHKPLWNISDSQKRKIEREIMDYLMLHGGNWEKHLVGLI